jgi:hypothetical protein
VRLAAPRETPDTERGDFIEGGKPCSFWKKTMKHQNKNVEIDGPNFKDLHVWYIEK